MRPLRIVLGTGVGVDDSYVDAVLSVVDGVGAGQVTTYGAVAAAAGRAGPRQVGRVMRLHGDQVAWWRVVRADGSPPTCHGGTAPGLLRAEGVPFRPDGRVDLERAETPTCRSRQASTPTTS